MVKIIRINFYLLFLLMAAIHCHAVSIEFHEVQSFLVPEIGDLVKVQFGDVDLDGHPDVLAADSTTVVLYSVYKDTILYSYSIEPPEDPSDWRSYDILLADINRDYMLDVAIGVHDISYEPPVTFKVFFLNGTSFFGAIDSTTVEFVTTPISPYMFPQALNLFGASDFDNDGYKEFVFSCDSTIGQDGYYEESATLKGITKIYYSFPDSVAYQDNTFYVDPKPFPEPHMNSVVLHPMSAQYYHMWGSGVYTQSQSISYSVVTDLTAPAANFIKDPDGFDFTASGCEWSYVNTTSMVECIGDIDITNYASEAVVVSHITDCCTNLGETECTYSDAIKLYSFSNPGSPSLLRTLPYTEELHDFVCLPDHPGYYFAFDDHRFIQFRGEDGGEFQSTQLVPTGIKYWKDPYDDGQPHLVTLNGNTVSIYKPDVITDINDDDNPPIPAAFTLGQPYPNPFNAAVTIPVTAEPGKTLTVDIYNLLGQKIQCIYSDKPRSTSFNLTWNAANQPSGIYLFRAKSSDQTATVNSILLK